MASRNFLINRFNWMVVLALALTAFAAAGCGKDSVADSVARQQDLEREQGAKKANDVKGVVGTYVGVGQSKDGTYDIELEIESIPVLKDGTMIPQPMLTGSISTANRSLLDHKGKPSTNVAPFTNGTYDPSSRTFAVNVLGTSTGTAAVVVSCKLPPNDDFHMTCRWRSITAHKNIEFKLTKQ